MLCVFIVEGKMTLMKTYTELTRYVSFADRFRYLQLHGNVGKETFGFDRWLNQNFYRSSEWKQIRNRVIVRDNGCDLGIEDRPIDGRVYIHHINPISKDDIVHASDYLLNPEFLICCSHNTHNAIHYGDENLLITEPIIRTPNDTCPWRK